jgi:hypothetical protein
VLLDPLTPDQTRLISLVAEGFVLDGEWPIFDALEGELDRDKKDAWEVLHSFPRVGSWSYSAVWWAGINHPTQRPSSQTEIELTLVGMYHSSILDQAVPNLLRLLEVMVQRRRLTTINRREPRQLSVNNHDAARIVGEIPGSEMLVKLLFKTLNREPSTASEGSTLNPDGGWSKGVPRSVLDYDGVSSIEGYATCLERLTVLPQFVQAPAVPSPLSLVAALDYLDVVWRLSHKSNLFNYPSAERAAKLSHSANTSEEFDSRLTALGEIIRSANGAVKANATTKLMAATRDDPLAPFEDYLTRELGPASETRIGDAITTLEHAISVRDAAQHTEAGDRGVQGLNALGVGHPIGDYSRAWQLLTSRVVEALDTLREEIATTSS